jgi:hypothetical protein
MVPISPEPCIEPEIANPEEFESFESFAEALTSLYGVTPF